MRFLSRAGAAAFFLWGLLHVVGGAAMGFTLRSEGPAAYLQLVAPSVDHGTLISNAGLEGTLALHAWNLVLLGGVVAGVALTLNRRNRRAGFWINAALVSGADIGLLALVVGPGWLPFGQAALGIVFWIVGVTCSGLALRASSAPLPEGSG